LKRNSTIFLQVVTILVGIGILAFMLWEPHIEGRNAGATLSQIYFNDPFLAYAYLASIPFFVALYQGFNVLGYIRHDKTFMQATVKALQAIKYCAIVLLGFVAVSVIFMYPILGTQEDLPAGIFMRIFIALASIVVATSAGIFKKILQVALDMKSQKDLAV